MVKRGRQPKYVKGPNGDIVGLSIHKSTGRYYATGSKPTVYFGKDKDLAIIRFHDWQVSQKKLTVSIDEIGPPSRQVRADWEHWVLSHPDPNAREYYRQALVTNETVKHKRVDAAAWWASVRAAYKKDPKQFRDLIGAEKSARLETLIETYQRDKHHEKPTGISYDEWRDTGTWWSEFCKITGAIYCADLTRNSFKVYRETIAKHQDKLKRTAYWSRRRFGNITTVIRYALSGEVELSPADREALSLYTLLKKPTKPRANPIDIDPDDFRAILEQAETTWDKAMLVLSLNAAYTPVDLHDLTWEMIDFRKGVIRFDREKAIARAKRHVPRLCAMWKRTADLLKKLRREYEARKITHPSVFLSLYGQPAHEDTFYSRFCEFCDAAGIDRTAKGKNGRQLSFKHIRKSALTAASNSTDPVVPKMQIDILSGHEIGIDEHYVVKKSVALAVEAIERTYFLPKKSRS